MKIAVLAGGLSPERDVSLSSGGKIAAALAERGHSVALVDVYMDQDMSGGAEAHFSASVGAVRVISEQAPELDAVAAERRAARGGDDGADELIGRGVIEICRHADVTFIALHGAMGENGQLQALLDCYGVRYTGSGYTGCAMAMDKEISKQMVRYEGVETAPSVCIEPDAADARKRILSEVGLPCVIKPTGCGSSVGVSLVKSEDELDAAVDTAARCRQTVMAERFVSGREFSVGVLRGEALPSIEIIPKGGFYDYKNKYQAGKTVEITPAQIPPELEARLRASALAAHRALRLGSYSRSDFIYDAEADRVVYLETNTLPGMTPTSLLPQEAAAVGIDYGTLCETIACAGMGMDE